LDWVPAATISSPDLAGPAVTELLFFHFHGPFSNKRAQCCRSYVVVYTPASPPPPHILSVLPARFLISRRHTHTKHDGQSWFYSGGREKEKGGGGRVCVCVCILYVDTRISLGNYTRKKKGGLGWAGLVRHIENEVEGYKVGSGRERMGIGFWPPCVL
jgi:hypothetical protein